MKEQELAAQKEQSPRIPIYSKGKVIGFKNKPGRDSAIPKDLVLPAYELFKGNADQVARRFGHSRFGLVYRWKRAGLKPKGIRYQRISIEDTLSTT